MGDKEHNRPLDADLPALTERHIDLERKVEDCESYLGVAEAFTSSEEQFRTSRDIEDYQEQLATLHEAIASIRREAGPS